jgi:iron transport multicopper oxidase
LTRDSYVDGLFGAFIIQDPNDPYASSYDEELVMLVGDWHHYIGFDLLATFMSSKNPSGEEPMPDASMEKIIRKERKKAKKTGT